VPTSSIPGVLDALTDGLSALTATGQDLASALVAQTAILDEEIPQFDRVVVEDALDIEREPMMYGERVERYTVPIFIEAIQQTGDLRPLKDHLWDLVTVVEDWLYANLPYGTNPDGTSLVVSADVIAIDDPALGIEGDTKSYSRTLRLACEARVRFT
jgi:hypothetical protein